MCYIHSLFKTFSFLSYSFDLLRNCSRFLSISSYYSPIKYANVFIVPDLETPFMEHKRFIAIICQVQQAHLPAYKSQVSPTICTLLLISPSPNNKESISLWVVILMLSKYFTKQHREVRPRNYALTSVTTLGEAIKGSSKAHQPILGVVFRSDQSKKKERKKNQS